MDIMKDFDVSACPKNPVRCANCSDHYQRLLPEIRDVIVSRRFIRDAPGFDVKIILSCDHSHFTRLHKFEFKVHNSYLFRALYDRVHILYAIDGERRLIFLRAFKNYQNYDRFLSDKKGIVSAIVQAASEG